MAGNASKAEAIAFQDWLNDRIEELARSIDDPKALTRRIGEILKQKLPERLSKGYWVTLEGNVDRGWSVNVYEWKLSKLRGAALRLNGLIGEWSAGIGLSTCVLQYAPAKLALWVGVGAVVPFEDIRRVMPVAMVSIAARF